MGATRTSEEGLKFIANWEGEVLHTYLDCVGIKTIGIGHVVLPGEYFPPVITHLDALEILRRDVEKCEREIVARLPELTQNQFDAMVSFGFNCGVGVYVSSSTANCLKQGNIERAADNLLLWCKAGGKTNQGLLNRRKASRAMFLDHDHEPQCFPQAHGHIEPITFEELHLFDLADILDYTPHHY